MGDVRDRDHHLPAAGVGRVVVGHRRDRIVEVAGVRAIDRHQGHIAQVLPAGGREGRQIGRRQALESGRKGDPEVLAVGREQGDAARIARLPQPLEHAGAIRTERARPDPLRDHQLARLRAAGIGGLQLELAGAGTGRPDAEAVADPLDRADHA